MNANGNQRATVKLAALPQTSTTPVNQEPATENDELQDRGERQPNEGLSRLLLKRKD